ncbi:UDP-4-amino-4,6-dideoxy-N-acetyl-beta-L-altrosamine transaminase [Alishewanella longhuensis]|uniref:UDP-4-amino-4, 6-dideoxy-N-acetyl-beta-L-altrosamine transaminase n=1 Tax=Alishewanella longhuensis TaxID=1091037 RepID=A0ABQ3KYI2_9ALTE|nr:UDP-4-amino-4,6-dideoxy-N-acetyl-beta-L-altrosamine transaminase [Alishewanella longhuensis]GHG69423.1 UDP-4-amino-4,6-dideoxy-N-acetyl-beta-L-altrosamine transaminase [Alishewanella longhuensis]
MIPYGKQQLDAADLAAVQEVLQSNWLTQGPKVPEFEQAIAIQCQAQFAVAVNSATSALHIACLALDVGPGDIVWTSPNSFVASANCALYCGAQVDFVDIDLANGNICCEALTAKLIHAKQTNTLPKVLIPVHFAGQSCDMAAIAALAKEYGFTVLEDASHAIGASYLNQPVGICAYADICVFSFHPVKIITSGEGGIATTNNPKLARKMQLLRSHGITAEPDELTEPSHGVWYYQQQSLGYNYRMTDIQAALAISQLTKLPRFVAERHQLAKWYDNAFAGNPHISPLQQQTYAYSSYHLYVVRLTNLSKTQHKDCIHFLRQQGIIGHLHYIPIYLQPYYKQLGFAAGHCPRAEQYYQQAVTLPLYPGLTTSEQQSVVDALQRFLEEKQ